MNWIQPILVLLTAFLAVYAQATLEGFRYVTGTQFNLLPALMVYAALSGGTGFVALLAVCGGTWLDSLSANPLGVSVLPLLAAGLVINHYRSLLLRQHRYAQVVLGLASGAAVPLLTVVLLLSLNTHPLLGWGSLWQWLVMTLVCGVATPVFFEAFDRLSRALSYPHLPESSLRANREIKRGRF